MLDLVPQDSLGRDDLELIDHPSDTSVLGKGRKLRQRVGQCVESTALVEPGGEFLCGQRPAAQQGQRTGDAVRIEPAQQRQPLQALVRPARVEELGLHRRHLFTCRGHGGHEVDVVHPQIRYRQQRHHRHHRPTDQVTWLGQAVTATARRVETVMKMAASTAPASPLNGATAPTRRFTVASFAVEDCVDIAERYSCQPNDVILAAIAGAIRRWLLSREQAVDQVETIRAMVPLSAYPVDNDAAESDADIEARGMATSAEWMAGGLHGFVTDLPVGEANPAVRLSQVAQLAERHSQSGRRGSVGVETWIPEIGPATFHAMSARATASLSRRSFNLPITIARGPRAAQYLGGNEILAIYPVPVLVRNRALAVGLTSYNGRIYFGLNADRGVMWDLGAMAEYLTDSFDELLSGAR